MDSLPPLPLPEGIESTYVDCTESCGLTFHILEAGKGPDRPLLLFAHGFPESAYSWRKLLPRFAAEGYYTVAMDQRGYGRTTGWDRRPYADVDLTQFRFTQLVRDALCLVYRLGRKQVDCIIGHDFGGVTAAMCALMRPDFFRACVIMSHPFDGVPSPPFGDPPQEVHSSRTPTSRANGGETSSVSHNPNTPAPALSQPSRTSQTKHPADPDIQVSLAQLGLKHYKHANSSPTAATEWDHPAQGLPSFLRGYFYLKSGLNPHNKPHPLSSWTAPELAKMPGYYIQPLPLSMAQTISKDAQDHDISTISTTTTTSFLPEPELAVYVSEWQRTGFQGALNWYRSGTSPANNRELLLFAGRKIESPALFVSGDMDWGTWQNPGALQGMQELCADFRGVSLVPGAGHWVQQEKVEEVFAVVREFLAGL